MDALSFVTDSSYPFICGEQALLGIGEQSRGRSIVPQSMAQQSEVQLAYPPTHTL